MTTIIKYGAAKFLANRIEVSDAFHLSVAAATTDDFSDPIWGNTNKHLFEEAYASWSTNINGTVKLSEDEKNVTWTPDESAGVKSSTNNAWTIVVAAPSYAEAGGLLSKGKLANEVANTTTYTWS